MTRKLKHVPQQQKPVSIDLICGHVVRYPIDAMHSLELFCQRCDDWIRIKRACDFPPVIERVPVVREPASYNNMATSVDRARAMGIDMLTTTPARPRKRFDDHDAIDALDDKPITWF